MQADPGHVTVVAETLDEVIELRAEGVLDSHTYGTLRDHIIKAALDAPSAVIVDVSRLVVSSPSAWAVFTSAAWHVAFWPNVPLMLVCTHAVGREAATRNGVARHMAVHANTEAALDALAERMRGRSRRRTRADLTRGDRCVRRSRQLVEEWLSAWSMGDYIPAAKVIVTTFVENVLDHTDSAPNVRLETDGVTVTVAVEDTSHTRAEVRDQLGARPRPSGLHLVSALCQQWGNAPTTSGKTVWAMIGPENRL
jgi:hypothetical protein